MADDPVLQTVPLGFQWPTVDPFLFCVHHNDAYPVGTEQLGPDRALLRGRPMGSDFSGQDGWSMYHGQVVPGFPQHPHRGFETVTFARRGLIDHSDSLGAAARFGRGDVQWLTAGKGIVHSEMFPLLNRDSDPNSETDHAGNTAGNHTELFQIWLNLPARNKMADPYFTMLWDHNIPRHVHLDADRRVTTVTVIAGTLEDSQPPSPPPDSWASQPDSDVAIWHINFDSDATFDLPPSHNPESVRVLYVFEGSVRIGTHTITAPTAVVVANDQTIQITAETQGAEVLMLQGRPIGEPVVQHGPFVMNTREEIQQAFADYQRTQFGGWPWPEDGPVHGTQRERFARHADGHLDLVNDRTGRTL